MLGTLRYSIYYIIRMKINGSSQKILKNQELSEDEIKNAPTPHLQCMYVSMQNDVPTVYWSLINHYFHC